MDINPPDVDDLNYDELDPGVRQIVKHLRMKGFRTIASGDGVSKSADSLALPFRHVLVQTAPFALAADADEMAKTLYIAFGRHWVVEASYSTVDKTALLFAREVAGT